MWPNFREIRQLYRSLLDDNDGRELRSIRRVLALNPRADAQASSKLLREMDHLSHPLFTIERRRCRYLKR